MQRIAVLKRISWKYWTGLLLVAAIVPAGALFVGADEPVDAPQDLLVVPTSQAHVKTQPARDEKALAAQGPLVECTYDLAEVVARYRKEVDDRGTDEHRAIEWFAKRAAPGPWKENGLNIADERSQDRPLPATEEPDRKNKSARFELNWDNDNLIVVHTAAGQKLIADRLEVLKTHGFAQVVIEVRIISGQNIALDRVTSQWQLVGASPSDRSWNEALPAEAREALISGSHDEAASDGGTVHHAVFESIVRKPLPAIMAMLEDEEARLVIEAAQDNSRSNITFAPKVTVFNGESARIEDITQRPFVVGIRAATASAQQPLIQVVSEGTRIRVRPELRSDDRVFIDLGVEFSDIRSVETFHLPVAAQKHELEFQIPEVLVNRLHSAVEFRLDQMLAIGLPANSDESFQPGCILVKVRKIDDNMVVGARRSGSTAAPEAGGPAVEP